jgi:hypothetical protein
VLLNRRGRQKGSGWAGLDAPRLACWLALELVGAGQLAEGLQGKNVTRQPGFLRWRSQWPLTSRGLRRETVRGAFELTAA